MMRRICGLMAMAIMTLLLACGGDDDGGGITDEQRQLVMGQSEGVGVFHTGLEDPLVLARDAVHSNVRELDLNNDGVIDIAIRAFEEFGGNPKGLTITTTNDSTRVLMNASGQVTPLEEGDVITIESTTWTMVDQSPLAVLEGGTTTGVWNMAGRRFVAVRMDIGISRFLAWIELSVEDYDNYSFYNLALRAVP